MQQSLATLYVLQTRIQLFLNKSQIRWGFVALAYLTLLCQSILDNARGPAYPNILETFEISASRGAYLFALASFAGLISNMAARWWLPKLDIIWGSTLSLLFMAIGSFLFGLSSDYGLWLLDASSLIMGLGMGSANVAMNLLIARGTPLKQRRQIYAGLHSIYGLGSLSAPLLLSVYMAASGTWSGFFQWLAILPSLVMFVCLLRHKQLHLHHEKSERKQNIVPPISFPSRLAYGMVFGFYVASEIIISTRLVIYLNNAHQISLENARMSLSAFFLSMLLGRFLFTIIPLKGASQRWLLLSCALTISTYILAQLFNPFILVLTGLTMSYFYPVAMDWLSKKFPNGIEWMTASVLTAISIMLVTMHLGFGFISDHFGIEIAMAFVPIFQTICLLLLIFLGKAENHIART